jgi:predicted SAM-dependent methyltransferase
MLNNLIKFVLKIIGKVSQKKKIMPVPDSHDGLVKINLGCGLRVASGWLNIDGSLNALVATWPNWIHRLIYQHSGSSDYYSLDDYCNILKKHKFFYHDLSISLPLCSNSVDFIYSSHFFEHLFKDDALMLLKSCFEALKPSGTLRISIPDLAYAISLYEYGRKAEMLNNFFFVEGKGNYFARHKYMYDYELIKESLEQAGFLDITRCDYQKGKTPDIHLLDVYPKESLFVEAVKGN